MSRKYAQDVADIWISTITPKTELLSQSSSAWAKIDPHFLNYINITRESVHGSDIDNDNL